MAVPERDFPPYRIVFHYFRAWQRGGMWDRIHDALRTRVRQQAGKTPKPSAAILDSQSVKTTEQGGPKGYDAGEKISGRQRHLVVDTLGMVWALVITRVSVQDGHGAKQAVTAVRAQVKFPKIIWADAAYCAVIDCAWIRWVWNIVIVRAEPGQKGFQVQPKRRIMERTFDRLNRSRHLPKDYEQTFESSKAFTRIAMINLVIQRLRKAKT